MAASEPVVELVLSEGLEAVGETCAEGGLWDMENGVGVMLVWTGLG